MARIAMMTFSVLRAPYGDTLVQEFDDRTPDVFTEAETWPGFAERAKADPDTAWMTNFQKSWGKWGPFAVPRFYLGGTTSGHTKQAQTLSVWRDIPSVWQFTYRGPLHRVALQRRGNWFLDQDWPIDCLWWVDDGAVPTWPEACERLEHLERHRATPVSFTFKSLFGPDGVALAPVALRDAQPMAASR